MSLDKGALAGYHRNFTAALSETRSLMDTFKQSAGQLQANNVSVNEHVGTLSKLVKSHTTGYKTNVAQHQQGSQHLSGTDKTRQDMQATAAAGIKDAQQAKAELQNGAEGEIIPRQASSDYDVVVNAVIDKMGPGFEYLMAAIEGHQDLSRKSGKVRDMIEARRAELSAVKHQSQHSLGFPGQKSTPPPQYDWDEVSQREVEKFVNMRPEDLPEIKQALQQASFLETQVTEQERLKLGEEQFANFDIMGIEEGKGFRSEVNDILLGERAGEMKKTFKPFHDNEFNAHTAA